jgi:hypothetical protein
MPWPRELRTRHKHGCDIDETPPKCESACLQQGRRSRRINRLQVRETQYSLATRSQFDAGLKGVLKAPRLKRSSPGEDKNRASNYKLCQGQAEFFEVNQQGQNQLRVRLTPSLETPLTRSQVGAGPAELPPPRFGPAPGAVPSGDKRNRAPQKPYAGLARSIFAMDQIC